MTTMFSRLHIVLRPILRGHAYHVGPYRRLHRTTLSAPLSKGLRLAYSSFWLWLEFESRGVGRRGRHPVDTGGLCWEEQKLMRGSKLGSALRAPLSVVCLVAFAIAGCSDSSSNSNMAAVESDAVTTATCGNGVIEGDEKCDYAGQDTFVLMGDTCEKVVPEKPLGALACMPGCLEYNTDGCYAPPASNCGNGMVDVADGEQCDYRGTMPVFQTGMATCPEVTMGQMMVGALGCAPDCTFDLQRCAPGQQPGGMGGMGGGGMGGGGTGGGGTGG